VAYLIINKLILEIIKHRIYWAIISYKHFFFFFDMCTQGKEERGIQTNDFHFIMRGTQPIELSLKDPTNRSNRLSCVSHNFCFF
jgi:hypothetical protein